MAEPAGAEDYQVSGMSKNKHKAMNEAQLDIVFQIMHTIPGLCTPQYEDDPPLRACMEEFAAKDAILEPGIGKTFEK